MGRAKKYRKPKPVSVLFESEERDDLRLVAARQRMSVSEFIRLLVMSIIQSEPELADRDAEDESAERNA